MFIIFFIKIKKSKSLKRSGLREREKQRWRKIRGRFWRRRWGEALPLSQLQRELGPTGFHSQGVRNHDDPDHFEHFGLLNYRSLHYRQRSSQGQFWPSSLTLHPPLRLVHVSSCYDWGMDCFSSIEGTVPGLNYWLGHQDYRWIFFCWRLQYVIVLGSLDERVSM